MKMLSGNYLTYEVKSQQSGGPSHCRLGCTNPLGQNVIESLCHVISSCSATHVIRQRFKYELHTLLSATISYIDPDVIIENKQIFTQFCLDPASMNLQERVHINDPMLTNLFWLSRDFCSAIDKKRMTLLREMSASR